MAYALLAGIVSTYAQGVPNPFDVRYQVNTKGDITFIGNNILNRDTSTQDPEDPYNVTGNASTFNDLFNMRYIDVDTDPTTFSSSRATLTLPDQACSRIIYAGLYWSAVYRWNEGFTRSPSTGDGIRENDFNQVKLQVPGSGTYVDITADEILFDGFNDPDFGVNAPYACYADVTSLISGLADPNGEYTMANVRATNGFISGGGAAGWSLVVVFENPTLPGKFITTFDGFAGVDASTGSVDVDYNGFITLPPPFPVRANLSTLALEGDNRITGDALSISAASNAGFTTLGNAVNPTNNFFNSNVTIDGAQFTDRVPNSINTLGYDADRITIANPLNSVIPNDETGATLRMFSTQDRYYIYFNSFDVEVIEPDIVLAKTVEDGAGNDIGGLGVTLGQEIVYVLSFQNVGNDDATGYTIRDVLPANVNFPPVGGTIQPGDLILPAPINGQAITYTFDAATNEITFNIPDVFVESGDPEYEIRFKVRVVNSCNELRDACSNIIENTAFSSYTGLLNDIVVSDDPSFLGFDVCNFGIPGATNFLTDLDDCDFVRDEILCGESVVLTAGNGFTTYEWRDSGGNVIANTQSVTVTQTGTYTATVTAPAPCLSFTETVNVVLFGNNATNPVIPFADEVDICPNDGDEYPQIFLCGLNDSRFIDTDITDATSIVWEVLDESSCPPVGIDGCANKNSACTWNQVSTGNDFNVTTAGQYRLVINYQNGCFNRFFFNVTQNVLNPNAITSDIICNTPGEITITNVPADYEYSLDNPAGPYQASPVFTISTAGTYTVYIRQTGVPVASACVFSVPDIDIRERDFTVDVIPGDILCAGDLGSLRIQVNDVEPQYFYEISQGGTSIDTFGPTNDNDYTFVNVPAGTYTVTVTTDDGCNFSGDFTIQDFPDLTATAVATRNITCNDGEITVTPTGGLPPYFYSIDGGTTFQSANTFTVTAAGTYSILVVDSNNCTFTTDVDVLQIPDPVFTVDPTDTTCNGVDDGTITFNVTNANGFTLEYSIDAGTNFQSSNTFTGLTPGTYDYVLQYSLGPDVCQLNGTVTIGQATVITADAVLTQDYTCLTDGQITVQNETGGTPPYQYSLDGATFQASNVFTGLTDGTFNNITIRDANGCAVILNPITIDPLNEPTDLTFAATALVCDTGNLVADVTVSVVDGNAPFTFEIIAPAGAVLNNGNNNVFAGLAPGTYTFRVTDDKGCTIEEAFTIDNITPISLSASLVSDEVCFNANDGALSFTVANFATTYDYTVVNSGGTTVASGTSSNTTENITGLAPDTYTITVTDTALNCLSDTDTVTIAGPPAALAATFDVDDITCTTDGSVTINATGGWGGYEYRLEFPDTSTSPFQASNTFNNLTDSGTYTVTVRDSRGCEFTDTFTLTDAVSPDLSIAPNDFCFDPGVGLTITATINSGGTAPFQYRINGGALQSSNVFSGLAPGTYTVEVVDSRNCTDSASVTINDPINATAVLNKDLDCSASPDAIIEVTANDGYPAHSFEVSFNGGAFAPATGTIVTAGTTSTLTFTTNTAGDYQFRVTDTQSCTVLTNTVTVTPAENPQATAAITTPISCDAGSDGVVTITVDTAFGTPPYLISFDGSTPSAQTVYAGLSAGTYSFTITDNKGCTFTDNITLTDPDPITAVAEIATDFTCLTNGAITIQGGIAAGGTPPYQYSLDGATFQASPTFSGLTDGTYTITVRDANGCTFVTNPVTLDPLNEPTDLTFAATALVCDTGNLVADVTVSVVDGNAPFTFEIIAPAGAVLNNGNNNVFAGLAPGTYTFRVTDDKGCTIEEAFTIDNITPISLSASLVSDEVCFNANDGALSFTVANFATTYDYTVVNSGGTTVASGTSSNTTENITGLAPDTYTITVTDTALNCLSDTDTVTIAGPPAALDFTQAVDQPTCNDPSFNDGVLTITAFDGWGGYEYQLDDTATAGIDFPYQNSNVFSGLTPGTYTVFVRDSRGCEVTQPLTINTPVNPTVTIAADTFCYDPTTGVTITATPAGGVAPYEFSINGSAFQPGNTFANLTPGTYTVTVRDSNACTGTSNTIIINDAINATAVLNKDLDCSASPDAIIEVTANDGYPAHSFEVSFNGGAFAPATGTIVTAGTTSTLTFTTNTAGDYQFRVTDTQSCTVLTNTVTVTPAENPQATAAITTPISCDAGSDGVVTITVDTAFGTPPYLISFDGSTPSAQTVYAGLSAGTYSFTITDNKGCTFTDNITLTDPDPITAVAEIATDFTCLTNGAITIQGGIAAGGTPPYQYSLDGATFQASPTFSGLTDGTYTITVRDANGCTFVTNPVTLDPLNEPTDLTFAATALVCDTGNLVADVTVSVVDGNAPFTFEIIAPAGAVLNNGNNNVFAGLAPGTYTFRVTDDKGCTIEEAFTIDNITPISLSASLVSDEVCFNANDGALSFTVANFATTYDYTVVNSGGTTVASGTSSNTTENITGLAPDTYTITVTDTALNCLSDTDTVTIAGPPAALDFTQAVDQPTCNDPSFNDGVLTITAFDGWGGYEYQLDDTATAGIDFPYQNSNVFSGLTPGTYTVFVRDSRGCEVTQPLTINTPVNPTVTIAADTFCYDPTTGVTITATPAGGVAPYEFSINGSAFQPGNTFANLTPGTYTVTVRDSNACTGTSNTIIINDAINATAVLNKDLDCSASPDAIIEVTANDGYPAHSFEVSFNGGAFAPATGTIVTAGTTSTLTFTTNTAGDYTFRVVDTESCPIITNTITVTPADLPDFTVTPTDVLCNGDLNGTLTVNINPAFGVPPFEYSLDGGVTRQNNNVFTGLAGGTYNVTVIDNKECSTTIAATIAEPDALVATVTGNPLTCDTSTGTSLLGSVDVVITTASTPNYTYRLLDNTGALAATSSANPIAATPATSVSFADVDFGDYTVVIDDGNGCQYTFTTTVATGPDVLITTTGAAGCTDGSGSMTVEAQASNGTLGVGNFFFAVFPAPPFSPAEIGVTWFASDPSPPAPLPNTFTFTGLTPGVTYTFIVHDDDTGCEFIQEATVPVAAQSNLTSTVTPTDVTCNGAADGSVDFTVDNYDAGATSIDYEVFVATTNATTGITGTVTPLSGGVENGTVSPLAPGEYFILFTEVGGANNGCVIASDPFIIREAPDLLSFTTATTNDNCNLNAGSITVNAQFGVPPYEYSIDGTTFQTSNVFNVEAGTYTVTVRDASGCVQPQTNVVVGADPEPVISASVTNQCTTTEGNFTINVNLDTAGVPPYSYSFNGGAFQTETATNFDYTNLSSGTYTIEVRDANGCGNSISLDIFQPTDLVPVVTVQPTCNNNDGVVTINVTGGSGTYEYDLLDGLGVSITGGARQASNVFTGLAADNYTAVVFDIAGGSNCSAQRPVDLEVPTAVQFTENTEDVSCNGGNDGSIEVILDPTSDNPPYVYSLNGGTTTQTSNVFTGLTAGTYNVTVISGRDCNLTRSVTINEPDALAATASSTPLSCDPSDNSVNDAVITITATDGTPPYTYSLNGGAFVSSNTFNVASDATYNIVVRDDNGCTFPLSETVPPLQRVNIDNITIVQNIDCTQPEIIDIIVSGGSGNYQFIQLPSGTPQASNQFTLTAPGTYTFQVNDLTLGCFDTVTHTIAPFDLIDVSATLVSNVTCFNGTDGELSLTTANYTGTYDYFVLDSGGATVTTGNGNAPETINIAGLAAGTYTVRVVETQTPFCEETTNVVTITSPDAAVDVTATATLANCNVGAIITPVGTGGSGVFEYSVVPQGNPPGVFSSATSFEVNPATYPATFTVYVRDANANICTDSVDITVDTDPLPTVTLPTFATDQCTSNGTSFTFTATGTGVAPLEYSIDGVSFQSSPTFNVSTDGTYTVTIRDANGCTATDTITIFPPLDITAIVTAEEFCNPANNGEITLTAIGGSGNYQYRMTAPTAGAFQASNVFSGLTDGTFTFEVEDTTTNCTDTVTITIDAPTPVVFTLTPVDVSCNGGNDGEIRVNLDPSNDEPPYLYSLDGGTTTQTSPIFTGLTAGPYNVTVISAKGCEDTISTTINEPDALTATASSTPLSCDPSDNSVNDAVITITATDGTPPYTYSLNGGAFVSSNTFNVASDATYNIVVRDDNGCTFPLSETVPPLQRVNIDNITIVQNIDCTQPEIIDIIVSGGSGNYQFIQLPSGTPQASNQFTLTAPGTYTFQVNDLTLGCFDTVTHTIAPFDLIDVSATLVSNVTCFNGTDGELSLTTANYTGTYDYFVLDSGGATVTTGNGNAPETINIAGLAAGTYTVRVVETQTPFCEETTNVVTITSPDAAVDVTATATLANCNVGAIITPVGTGGSGVFEYSVVPQGNPPGVFSSATSFEVNPATYPATFTVYVRDANANICTDSVDITVDTDPLPTVTLPTFATDQCTSNGTSFTFTATGTGVAPLEYSIDGVSFQSSPTFNVSTDGTYTVTIRDANGCTATDTITIFPPLDVSVAVDAQPSCVNNDGSITATGTGGSGNPANYRYTLLDGATVVQGPNTTGVFTGLTGGIAYTVRFEDTTVGAPICIADETITLEIATPVTLLPTDHTDISCNGAADGSITVNLEPSPANDNPPYTFVVDNGVDPAITQNNGVFTGLNPGTYTITVTSNRGCIATDTVIIDEPLTLNATASSTPLSCDPSDNSVNDAIITVTVTPGTGTPPYTYSLNGGAFVSSNTFNVASDATYNIVVRDDNGCTFPLSETVPPLQRVNIDNITIVQNIDCTQPEIIDIIVSGGSGNYQFIQLPSGTPQASNQFTLTAPGTYTFQVNDLTLGCFDTVTHTIAPFDLIDVSAAKVSDITCVGDTDGELSLTTANYTGTYDYFVLDSGGATVATGNGNAPETINIAGLAAGTYTVRVVETQTPFCEETTNVVTINSPATPLAVSLNITDDLTCLGNDGALTAVASGGWGGYEYRLLRNGVEIVPFGTNNIFTGLDAATYIVEVRDANGCIRDDNEPLVQPAFITATAVQVDGLVCRDDETASIRATATGGRPDVDPTANYQYILNVVDPATNTIISSSAAQTSDLFTGLGAGTYSITVIDGWNCDNTTNTITITNPAEIIATLVQNTEPTCLTDGSITLSVTGGNAPYNYSDDGGATFTGSFTTSITLPAPANDYQFIVRDVNGCLSNPSNQVTIDPVPPVAIQAETTVDVGCFGEATGLIQVSASGGQGNYEYILLAADQTTVVRPAQPEDIFRDLTAGTYFIRVNSGVDCTEILGPININQGPDLTARAPIVVNPICVDDMGSITVELQGGTGVYQFAISPNLNEFQSENVFDELAPGNYTIVAQDSNGCKPFIFDVQIIAPQPLAATADTILGETCAGNLDGSITVSITGGTAPYSTRIVSTANNPLTFDPNFVQDQFTFPGLAGGFPYVIFIVDANGCETQVAAELPEGVVIDPEVRVETICNGETLPTFNVIVSVDENVENDVLYALDSMDDNALRLFDRNGFRNIATGDHFVRIVHSNGCEERIDFNIAPVDPLGITAQEGRINEIVANAFGGREDYEYFFNGVSNGNSSSFFVNETGTYQVRVVDANGCEAITEIFVEFIDIFIPNFFTPDGDGNNDTWTPRNTEAFPNIVSQVFDRYGRLLAEFRQGESWLGTYNGTPLPSGDYWYVVKLNDPRDQREFVGNFTLYR